MKSIKHNLTFVVELDENDNTAKRLLALSNEQQIQFLEQALKDMVAPRLEPILKELNEGNSWAQLKVAE